MRSKVKCKSGHCFLQYTYRLSVEPIFCIRFGNTCAMTRQAKDISGDSMSIDHTQQRYISDHSNQNEMNSIFDCVCFVVFSVFFFFILHSSCVYKRIVHQRKENDEMQENDHETSARLLRYRAFVELSDSKGKLRIQDDLKLTMSVCFIHHWRAHLNFRLKAIPKLIIAHIAHVYVSDDRQTNPLRQKNCWLTPDNGQKILNWISFVFAVVIVALCFWICLLSISDERKHTHSTG